MEDPVTVPDTRAMSDETFRLHLEARHVPVGDFSNLTSFRSGKQFSENRATFETYHDRCHDKYEYEDHEHAC